MRANMRPYQCEIGYSDGSCHSNEKNNTLKEEDECICNQQAHRSNILNSDWAFSIRSLL